YYSRVSTRFSGWKPPSGLAAARIAAPPSLASPPPFQPPPQMGYNDAKPEPPYSVGRDAACWHRRNGSTNAPASPGRWTPSTPASRSWKPPSSGTSSGSTSASSSGITSSTGG